MTFFTTRFARGSRWARPWWHSPALAFFSSNETFCKLAAYSCLAVLLLGFTTVAAALWSGP